MPDLFWAELGNVLWKGSPKAEIASGRAQKQIASDVRGLETFATVPSSIIVPEALRIAFAYDRSVYDCLYVALAVQSKTDLITADERLANALAARLPVKWLGAV